MKKLFIASLLVALLAGCVQITKVDPGNVKVGGGLTVKTDRAWNDIPDSLRDATAHWTRDGLTLDNLLFFVALEDGAKLGKLDDKNKQPIVFKASMQSDQLVGMIESYYSRAGSKFTLNKVESTSFVGEKGVKVRFTLIRAGDDLKLSGVAWAAIRNKQFTAMMYTAPALGFFPKSEPTVTQMAESAQFK